MGNGAASQSKRIKSKRDIFDIPLMDEVEYVNHRGLANHGENNCFLNVVIQSLWHLTPVRERLLSAAPHRHVIVSPPKIEGETDTLLCVEALLQVEDDVYKNPLLALALASAIHEIGGEYQGLTLKDVYFFDFLMQAYGGHPPTPNPFLPVLTHKLGTQIHC